MNPQHDCQEFLALLLDSLHEELNSCALNNHPQHHTTTTSLSDISSSQTVSTALLLDAGDSKSDESGVYLPDPVSESNHHDNSSSSNHPSHAMFGDLDNHADADFHGMWQNEDSNHSSGIVIRCKSPPYFDIKVGVVRLW